MGSMQFTDLIRSIADTFFGGSMTTAGLAVMVVTFVVFLVILYSAVPKASPALAAVPMIPLSIIFSAMGFVNSDVAALIVIVCAVLVASGARDLIVK